MQLETKYFGTIEIEEGKIIDFLDGLLGFKSVKKYIILRNIEGDSPFQWLQGVDNTDLAFVIINPSLFVTDYDFDIADSEVEVLSIQDVSNVIVYCIVVVPDDITKMTANLKAPLIINTENNKGKQVVIDNSKYPIKYYISKEKMGG